MSLSGKVVMITGGTRGIGLSAAERLAAEGADLFLTYKSDKENAEAAATRLREEHGVRVALGQVDMRKPEGLPALFESLQSSFDQLDVLVLNAAFGTMGTVARMGRYSWKATYDINVTAPLLTAREALPWLKRSKGRVLMISSVGCFSTFPQYSAIGTSKAAAEALARQMAVEWAQYGINVVSLSAGPIETRAIDWFRQPAALRSFAAHKSLAGRMGYPADLAPLIAMLSRDETRWISGTCILADGGLTTGFDASCFAVEVGQRQRQQEEA